MEWLVLAGLFYIWNSWDGQFTLMIELLEEIRDELKDSKPPTNTPDSGSAGRLPIVDRRKR